jgi:hypothetical protein
MKWFIAPLNPNDKLKEKGDFPADILRKHLYQVKDFFGIFHTYPNSNTKAYDYFYQLLELP